ncbi:hypothetical protein [Tissierella creatinophila]|uniref:Uncharacterized protein n=1 Tax=Tissierella creatinophila DSM 6911 TaxID=1123403 RepID=A0A1U7M8H1_TISCR|nr:hypothetical protein [Tissierella creatinophila]OLS03634.1 hypothetical protein TICRE_03300 [Tissierella creatinophila DSM 6911]
MKEIINRIIEIDKETNSIRIEVEELIEKQELELKKAIYNLEKESSIKTKLESEKIYEQIISQGKEEVKKLANKDIALLNKIHINYNKQKEKLVEKVFENLFLGQE